MGSCHHSTSGCCGSSALANNAIIFNGRPDEKNVGLAITYMLKIVSKPLTSPTGEFLDSVLSILADTSHAVDDKYSDLVGAAVNYAGDLTEYTQLENSMSAQSCYSGDLAATASVFESYYLGLRASSKQDANKIGEMLCSTIAFMEEANVSGWVDLDYLLSCVQSLEIDNQVQLKLNLEGHLQRFLRRQGTSKRPIRAVYDTTVCELDATYKLALVLDQYFPRLLDPDDEQLVEFEKDSLFRKTPRGPVGHIIGDAIRSRLRGSGWFHSPY